MENLAGDMDALLTEDNLRVIDEIIDEAVRYDLLLAAEKKNKMMTLSNGNGMLCIIGKH